MDNVECFLFQTHTHTTSTRSRQCSQRCTRRSRVVAFAYSGPWIQWVISSAHGASFRGKTTFRTRWTRRLGYQSRALKLLSALSSSRKMSSFAMLRLRTWHSRYRARSFVAAGTSTDVFLFIFFVVCHTQPEFIFAK